MNPLDHYPILAALGGAFALAFLVWILSVVRRDVSIVDVAWSLLIVLCAAIYWFLIPSHGQRAGLVMALAGLWAVRLALHIGIRSWGEPEDRRYREIRARNEPNFQWKSLYLVFFLQAVLAWIVSFSLIGALAGDRSLNWLDYVGALIVLIGVGTESIADWQLSRFQARGDSAGHVMDEGLWRYTRHPNYFGEFIAWWGFYLISLAAGSFWWSILSPLLMSVLLLRVSGVTLLEKDISSRRPGYADYVQRTNAFFPGLPRS